MISQRESVCTGAKKTVEDTVKGRVLAVVLNVCLQHLQPNVRQAHSQYVDQGRPQGASLFEGHLYKDVHGGAYTCLAIAGSETTM